MSCVVATGEAEHGDDQRGGGCETGHPSIVAHIGPYVFCLG